MPAKTASGKVVASLKVADLRAELESLGLATDGLKAVLCARLEEALAAVPTVEPSTTESEAAVPSDAGPEPADATMAEVPAAAASDAGPVPATAAADAPIAEAPTAAASNAGPELAAAALIVEAPAAAASDATPDLAGAAPIAEAPAAATSEIGPELAAAAAPIAEAPAVEPSAAPSATTAPSEVPAAETNGVEPPRATAKVAPMGEATAAATTGVETSAAPTATAAPMAELPAAAANVRSKAEEVRNAKNRKKKQHKKDSKQKQREAADAPASAPPSMPAESAERAPEIEYVSKLEPALKDPAFYEFAKVFEHFSSAEEPANPVASAGADAEGEAKVEGGEEDDDDLDGERGLSRKLKKAARITVAALKRSTEHPEVVEQWDVCASEPELLVHLKAARNAVPVPRHWSQKRAYLQGKRGVEKKPFQLPDFIAATGIEKIRQVVAQKEEAKKLKSRTREATRPKMNRLDLDYQVLHDAFFKYQTKPKMTRHGDVYWEGKENEVHLREKRPGQLSADVRRALGMGDDPLTPPPWLVNMQRYGPPPSYPLLRIPGLNAPLLEGASYGTHPGGWGKPPVDESGSPLYGNPFAPPPAAVGGEGAAAGSGGQEAAGKAWGEADSESEESADEEEEETGAEAEARGTASVSSVETGGTETPMGAMQLRKERPTGVETPSSVAGADTPISATPEPPRALYQVLEQKTNAIGSAAFGSAHTYSLPAPNAAADAAQPSAKAAKRLQGAVDVALDPSELEDLDEETLKRRYEETVNAGKRAAQREDFSDLIEEHEARKRRKQTKDN